MEVLPALGRIQYNSRPKTLPGGGSIFRRIAQALIGNASVIPEGLQETAAKLRAALSEEQKG
jgi:hypothetical protein